MTQEIAIDNPEQSPLDSWTPNITDFVVINSGGKPRLIIKCPKTVITEYGREQRSVGEDYLARDADFQEARVAEILGKFVFPAEVRRKIMDQLATRSTRVATVIGDSINIRFIAPLIKAYGIELQNLERKRASETDDTLFNKEFSRQAIRLKLITNLILKNSFVLDPKEK